jgi:LuxR family maltose regulon positive regulatory protein
MPEDKSFLRGMALSGLGMAHVLNGDFEAAVRAFEESAQLGQRIGNIMFAVGALCNLGGLCRERGQLRQAQAIYRRALDFATDERGRRLPAASRALFGLSDLLREWNDLDTAARLVEESLALSYGQMADLASCLHLAHIKQAQGDVSGANQVMENARQLKTGFEAGRLGDFLVEVSQARLWIEQGSLDAVLDWARQRGLYRDARTSASTNERTDTPRAYDIREIEYLILARIYVAQGRSEEALEIIDILLQAAQEQGRERRMIEMLNLKALALQAQGSTGEALAVIERSLSMAEPEGFTRIFLDEGPPMARLLYQAASHGIAPGYTGSLLAAFPVARPAAAVQSLHGEMVEPLSDREMEVLQLIAAGASNPEIAYKLVISVFTVKKHITNILGKLAVTNRTQAAARARELGLIEPDR